MWASINFLLSICLYISIAIGLTRTSAKELVKWIIYSRIFYLGTIISQVVITIRVFHSYSLLILSSDVILLFIIALIEMNYLKKEQGNLNKLNITIEFILILIYYFLQSQILFG